MSIFINGRYIKNFLINKAILDGYHTLLPIGRYPIAVLSITMDTTIVDINVHPAKLEARLSKEQELTALIKDGIVQKFKGESLIPEDIGKVRKPNPVTEQKAFDFEHNISDQYLKEFTQQASTSPGPVESSHQHQTSKAEKPLIFEEQPMIPSERKDIESKEVNKVVTPDNVVIGENFEQDESGKHEQQSDRLPPLYPIGQMHGTYIFAQNERGLYLIDQHAAQERIKYEYYRNKVGEVASELQDLLVPITFDFTHAEVIIISQHLEELKQVGVFLEPFGGQSFIARSHPQWFPQGEEKELIEEIVEQIIAEKKISIHKLREEAAIMMSCKGSIKANHHLRNDEIFELLETLRKAEDPFTCPHGRPIIIHFTKYEMEKMFKRVM